MEHTHTEVDPLRCPLAEELISTLRIRGPLTMDQLLSLFPGTTWWQFFEVIDSLSRTGHIAIHMTGCRDYSVSIPPRHAA
ncbi:hypothetical protein [Nitrospira sp. Nam74]